VFYGLRAGVLNMATMLAVVGCCWRGRIHSLIAALLT
jgi:hypothetical protein